MKKLFFVFFCTWVLLIACAKQEQQHPALDPQNLDLTIKAGDDFFLYANGNWIKNNPIPDEYSRYGAFEALIEKNYSDLQTIMMRAAKMENPKKGSLEQKIGDFYASGMDTVKIEKAGLSHLQPFFDEIDAIQNTTDVQVKIAKLHTKAISPLFGVYADQDEKNSEMMITQLVQGGLGLPDRDYYTSPDARSQEIRQEYLLHVEKMFALVNYDADSAKKAAEKIMDIETRLANASMTRLERRDPQKTYNKTDFQKLAQSAKNFDWQLYFHQIGLQSPGDINVQQPVFFAEIDRIIAGVPVQDWKIYLKWNIVNETAPYLNSAIVKQNFHFYGQILSGTKAMRPRWKRVLIATSDNLPEAVGQLYVEKYFPPEAKARMAELVNNLKLVLYDRISNLDWMSDMTKKKAHEKLQAMNVKIGYPEKWIDYSTLQIDRESFITNVLQARNFEFRRTLDKIDKPVDRNEWHMSPQTVNAYYNPTMNEIVFPAGILQYPFFNMHADDAVNYGAIGMVIGHEMTHGFDDQGRQYDKNGNLTDWWIKEDEEKFKKRAQVLVEQFNRFAVLDTLHVDGQLTLGENIADLGGLNIAYDALQKSFEGKPLPGLVDGFTPQQRFFLGHAQVWRQGIRDKELMRRLREDVHSPGNFRVNGPVSNMPEFYQAFSVKDGELLFREKAQLAKIW